MSSRQTRVNQNARILLMFSQVLQRETMVFTPANPTNEGTKTNQDGLPRILTYAFSPDAYRLHPSKGKCVPYRP